MVDKHVEPTEDDVRAFLTMFVDLYRLASKMQPSAGGVIAEKATAHLGMDPGELAPMSSSLPPVERASLQLAIDHMIGSDNHDESDDGNDSVELVELIGVSPELNQFEEFSFTDLLAGRMRHGPTEPRPPAFDQLPIDVDAKLRCVMAGIWLLRYAGQPVILALSSGHRHAPPWARNMTLEVFAADPEAASSFLDRLDDLRTRLNIYRRKVLMFGISDHGEPQIKFQARPTLTADHVILPDGDLKSVERHAIGIGMHAEKLMAAGQHLKRGLLLYGPPGTGKTHTVNYLIGAMPERTCVILQGGALAALGQGMAIVRNLSPSMLVLEDVDLIANERGMDGIGPGSPLLFELLNEMDGLTAADDVLFVLTSNRPEVLERALVARPGRIDHAVKIELPDAAARRRLLDLYLGDVDHSLTDTGDVVKQTDGVTASFIKELVRRAVYVAIESGVDVVDDNHMRAALTEMKQSLVFSLEGQVDVVNEGVVVGPSDQTAV